MRVNPQAADGEVCSCGRGELLASSPSSLHQGLSAYLAWDEKRRAPFEPGKFADRSAGSRSSGRFRRRNWLKNEGPMITLVGRHKSSLWSGKKPIVPAKRMGLRFQLPRHDPACVTRPGARACANCWRLPLVRLSMMKLLPVCWCCRSRRAFMGDRTVPIKTARRTRA